MDGKILRKAASGDTGAIRDLRDWWRELSGEADLSQEELDRIIEILRSEDEDQKAQFWADLPDLMTAVDSKPGPALDSIVEMEDRARRLGTCETVQVLGLRAYRLRLLKDLDAARRALEEAWSLAPKCRSVERTHDGLNPCQLDLHRRTARHESDLGRPEHGLEHAETAVSGYYSLGGPGHDLNGNGVASSLYTRGLV